MIEARGRNGHFIAKTIDIHNFSWIGGTDVKVSVFSKKEGKAAPIMFLGNRKQLAAIFRKISDSLASKSDDSIDVEKDWRPQNG